MKGVDVLQAAGQWLTDLERAELEVARKAALYAHASLAHDAISKNLQSWRTTPKFHFVDELFRCQTGWNSSHPWCFADEDFIGRLVRIGKRCASGDRLIRRYLLRLHLLLDKGYRSAPQL